MPSSHELAVISQESIASFELPAVIDTSYPHISIQDLDEVVRTFIPDIPQEIAESYESELQKIKVAYAPVNSTFYEVSAPSISVYLEAIASYEVSRIDKGVGVVHMDRYIGREQAGSQFARLEICRDSDNNLIARTGISASPNEQIAAVAEWVNVNKFDELVVVDDVVAFGDTIPKIIDILRPLLVDNVEIRILVAVAASGGIWRGIERIQESTGIQVEFLTEVKASPEVEGASKGMTIPVSRDLTIFGGKSGRLDDGREVTYPYMLPFSKPMASLTDINRRIEASLCYLEFNQQLVRYMEGILQRRLTIGDLETAGFATPHTSLQCLESVMAVPDSKTYLRDYLSYAVQIIADNLPAIIEESSNTSR